MKLDSLVLATGDLAAVRAFYADVLGLRVERGWFFSSWLKSSTAS